MPVTPEQLIAALPDAERQVAERVYENLKETGPKTLRDLLEEFTHLINSPWVGHADWHKAKHKLIAEARETIVQDRIQEALRVEQAKRVDSLYDRIRQLAELDEPPKEE